MDAVKMVHRDLTVVKEDRGPHNIVVMCKKMYFGAWHQYMEAQGTFEGTGDNRPSAPARQTMALGEEAPTPQHVVLHIWYMQVIKA